MKKRFFMLVVAMFTIFSCTACGSSKAERLEREVKELESTIEYLTEENSSLSQEVISLTHDVDSLNGLINSSDTALIPTIFWSDGNTYLAENCTFYYDCFCSVEVSSSNLRFSSPISLKIELANGNNAYVSLSNKGVVWSVRRPNFDEVE